MPFYVVAVVVADALAVAAGCYCLFLYELSTGMETIFRLQFSCSCVYTRRDTQENHKLIM